MPSCASCAATGDTSSPAPRQVPLLCRWQHPHGGGGPPLLPPLPHPPQRPPVRPQVLASFPEACQTLLPLIAYLEVDAHADLEARNEFLGSEKLVKHVQEVHQTLPDSPLMDKSSSSPPSMSNLPPIKIRVEDGHMVGLDERFSHITVQNQDDGVVLLVAPPPLPTVIMAANTVSGGGASSAATVSEDENDSSVVSATSLSKHTAFQEPSHVVTSESRAPTIPNDNKATISNPNSQIQMQQYHDSSYMLLPTQIHHHHHQFVQASKQSYIHHHPATAQAPISSYYPTYAPSQQQFHHHQIEQQYPMPPTLPPKTAAAMATPNLLHVNSNQFQQQHMGVPQMHHDSSQSIVANYGFEYPHQTHDHQVYYAQHPVAAPMALQYQTMTPATVVMLSQASAQLPADNTNQQIRSTSQLL
ncbi:hypothetical protein Acr_23g0006220 [Actinidia rufa]|uniref:Octicosapeptide/Phox/Bem1p family protein n=1 Tax=Actinidia rufa TaxID=165716 RepID=A0A7J0GN38_9ERIC|nr:hypothetical protein Acr_23g0006220 [Actinidia rufa]